MSSETEALLWAIASYVAFAAFCFGVLALLVSRADDEPEDLGPGQVRIDLQIDTLDDELAALLIDKHRSTWS